VGCIMGELILNAPLLSGKSEMEQIHKIFNLVGSPTAQNWPKHQDLPNLKRVSHHLSCWAGQYTTWLLIKLTPKGVVCFFLRQDTTWFSRDLIGVQDIPWWLLA